MKTGIVFLFFPFVNANTKKNQDLDKGNFRPLVRKILGFAVVGTFSYFIYYWFKQKKINTQQLENQKNLEIIKEKKIKEAASYGFPTKDSTIFNDLLSPQDNNEFFGYRVEKAKSYGLIIGQDKLYLITYDAKKDFTFLKPADFDTPKENSWFSYITSISGENNFIAPGETNLWNLDTTVAISNTLKLQEDYQTTIRSQLTNFLPTKLKEYYETLSPIPYFDINKKYKTLNLTDSSGNIFLPNVTLDFNASDSTKQMTFNFKFDATVQHLTIPLVPFTQS